MKRNGKTGPWAITTLLLIAATSSHAEEAPLYRDPSQPVAKRVADLMSRMTLEEKVTQVLCLWKDKNLLLDEDGRFVVEQAAEAIPHGVGHVARPSDNWQRGEAGVDPNRTPRETVELVNAIQRYLLEDTRLGIPAMMHEEGLLSVNWIAEHVPAIVDAWYLGQETGTALARVLFGDVNPGGKLPVTIPRSVGQLPMFYNHKPTARRGYLFDTTEPLWPFGFGLSYTTFRFGEPSLDRSSIAASQSAIVSVDITNTGERAGDEVIQLYVRDVYSSVTRPVKELKGFERITLAPGESRKVSFTVGPEQLRMFDRSMNRVVEPGEFELMVGGSSADVQSITLAVTSE